tara:strand:- start:303 stop:488 length:186 start_codon:yes stop_codon:yes gene_type:complete
MKYLVDKKILRRLNLAPDEQWIEKLPNVHPMKQITYAAIIQVVVFGGMLAMFQVNQWIFST